MLMIRAEICPDICKCIDFPIDNVYIVNLSDHGQSNAKVGQKMSHDWPLS